MVEFLSDPLSLCVLFITGILYLIASALEKIQKDFHLFVQEGTSFTFNMVQEDKPSPDLVEVDDRSPWTTTADTDPEHASEYG